MLVAIAIKAEPVTDAETRVFGLAIDQTLNPDFPTSQPEKVLKNPDGTPFQSSKAFTYKLLLDIPEGTHTIRFAPSSPSGYTWKAKIIVNRLTNLGEQTGLTSTSQYSATFESKTRTWEEIKKAIWEADRYLERLYHTIDYNGKTYGLIKSCPGVPIALKLTYIEEAEPGRIRIARLPRGNILGPGFVYHYVPMPELHYWFPTWQIVSVAEPEFETWDGTVELGFYAGESFWIMVAKLRIKYGPDPDYPSRMKAELELLEWGKGSMDFPSFKGDLYFGSEPDPNRPGLWRPKLVWKDAQDHVGEKVTFTTELWGCFPATVYWLGEDYRLAYYWWFFKLHRNKIPYVTRIIDDYQVTIDPRGPKYQGIRTDYVDDWLTHASEFNQICNVWDSLPVTPHAFSHWSSLCGPGAVVLFHSAVFVESITGEVMTGKVSCFAEPHNLAVAPHATYCMCKHGSPQKDVTYTEYVCVGRTCWKSQVTVSAEKLLLTGYKSCLGKDIPPYKEAIYRMLQDIEPWGDPVGSVNPENISGSVTTWRVADALAAYTILGYGFGNQEAQKIADALADLLLQLQWGVKPGEEGKGRLYVEHHGAWTMFTVNRPDHRGGFLHRFEIVEDENGNPQICWVKRPPRAKGLTQYVIDTLTSWFGWEPPGGIAFFTPTSTEQTLCAAVALRIYEYYKWRLR